MKKPYLLSIGLLLSICACETESTLFLTTYNYDSGQQQSTMQSFVIDFENYDPGDIVSEIFINDPFEDAEVEGITMAFPDSNAAMIFDSSNPSGNDFDLGTPNEVYGGPGIGNGGSSNDTALGNVLILSEDLDQTDPDDIFEIGASFVFDFSANSNVTLNSFDILDIETSNNPTIVNLFDINGSLIFNTEVIPGGDNSKTNVDLQNTSGVAYMEIIMNSSGAIDNIALELETEEECVECDSSIVELAFKNLGGSNSAIRIETVNNTIIFDETVDLDETFTIFGDNDDGTFSSDIIIFINDIQVGQLAMDCTEVIGPGLFVNNLEVISGMTVTGGQLCPVVIAF